MQADDLLPSGDTDISPLEGEAAPLPHEGKTEATQQPRAMMLESCEQLLLFMLHP